MDELASSFVEPLNALRFLATFGHTEPINLGGHWFLGKNPSSVVASDVRAEALGGLGALSGES